VIEEGSVKPPSISVVIATHDRPSALLRLLDSLETWGGYHDIVVVDDGSHPPVSIGSSSATLVRLDEPRLVSAARNEGAKASGGELVFFVDDDCTVGEGTLEALRRRFLDIPDAGIVGPVIAFLEKPQLIWSAGVVRTRWLGRTKFRGRGQVLIEASDLPPDCADFPSAFAVRRSSFDLVGGFDATRFPMHMEEADLAARIRAQKLRVVLAPEALAWHDISTADGLRRSLHLTSPLRSHLAGRSRMFFIRRHSDGVMQLALAMAFWLGVLVPFYVMALLSDSLLPFRERIRYLRRFLAGVIQGMAEEP
jgi:GT2 family glycosyltransferase